MWKISKTEGWGLRGLCSVSSVLCCASLLQGSPVTAGSLQKWGCSGGDPTTDRQGPPRDDEERGRTAHVPGAEGLSTHPTGLGEQCSTGPFGILSFWFIKVPKESERKHASLLTGFLSLPHCCFSPIVLLPLTPFSCMEQKPTRLLLGLCLHWQMWDGWCSRRCPGLKWVNLNRFRVWMLLWQMSSTITAISFWKTGLEMSWKMWVIFFFFPSH